MTALDDFMAEYDRPLRRVVLPIYFGLAIVVEEAVLRSNPGLAAVMDRLSGGESKQTISSSSRSRCVSKPCSFSTTSSTADEQLLERAASRYLDLLKSALLDEHYLDNEVRLWYLADCISRNRPPDKAMLRDPVRQMKQKKLRLENSRRTGALSEQSEWSTLLPYTDTGRIRLDALEGCLDRVRANGVEGHLVDCGTGRGGDCDLHAGLPRGPRADQSRGLGRGLVPSFEGRSSGPAQPFGGPQHRPRRVPVLRSPRRARAFPARPVRRDASSRSDRRGGPAADRRGCGRVEPRRARRAVRKAHPGRLGRYRRLRRRNVPARGRRVPHRERTRPAHRTPRLDWHVLAKGHERRPGHRRGSVGTNAWPFACYVANRERAKISPW